VAHVTLSRNVDHDRFFRTDHLMAGLKGHSVRGGAVTLAAQAVKFVVQILQTVVLARLLMPEDFGLVAMAGVITGFVGLFKDLGLSMATVQQANVNHAQMSTLFWINVAVGVLLAGITAALAPAIGWFYGQPKVGTIALALAPTLVLGGLTVQHQALLSRQMRFTALAVIDIVVAVVAVAVGAIVAYYGGGFWALVALTTATALVNAIAVWVACGWRPGLPVRGAGVRQMLAFGGNLTGFGIVNYFARNTDGLLLGKFWGAWQLGLYNRAYQLLLLPLSQVNAPLTRVAIPALSRLQDDPPRYRRAYLSILEQMSLVVVPGVALLIATCDWVLGLALGPQWGAAVPIFAWLGLTALTQPLTNSTGWLFISQGRTREMFQWGLIGSALTVVLVAAGIKWGPVGVARTYALGIVFVVTPLLFWFIGRSGPVRTFDFYRVAALPLLAAGAVVGVVWLFRYVTHVNEPWSGITLSFVLAATTTIAVYGSFASGRRILTTLWNWLPLNRAGRGVAPPPAAIKVEGI
jgi:O-antigen/teichoic acid export membrane protein